MGDRVYAAERIMKKRVRRVSEIIVVPRTIASSHADVCPPIGYV
jgi:hypothetical protein